MCPYKIYIIRVEFMKLEKFNDVLIDICFIVGGIVLYVLAYHNMMIALYGL